MVTRLHTREASGLRLDRELRFWHDGERVEHAGISKAFLRGVTLSDDGRPMLRIGADWCFIAVDEAAFGVDSIAFKDGEPWLTLSDGAVELLDAESLRLGQDGEFLALVKGGRALARFSRQAQVDLGLHLEADSDGFTLALPSRTVVLRGLGGSLKGAPPT